MAPQVFIRRIISRMDLIFQQKNPGLTARMSADDWGVQLLCLEFMRSVMVAAQPCLHMKFPVPFCGVRSLPCTTVSQILEVGPVGDACQVCMCHNAPLQSLEAGKIFRDACTFWISDVTCPQNEPVLADVMS